MKKSMLFVTIALAIFVAIGLISAKPKTVEPSYDEQVAIAYVENEYCDVNYDIDIWQDQSGDKYIVFMLYKDGKPYRNVSINRDYYAAKYL